MRSVDWQKWAAISEVFGTIAVVVSLIFVGISIRQNTAVVQANQQNLLYELTDNWFSDRLTNPELYEIELRALDSQNLTDVERLRYSELIYRAMNVWENAYFKHENGFLSDEQYQAFHDANVNWVECCAPRWTWGEIKDDFRSDFVKLVDAIYREQE